ncbi:MAG: aldo/keto reductase [Planctomycetota bacterium]|jgi:aryl-alcohol dehydrogenase-like predicted oxidoreductase
MRHRQLGKSGIDASVVAFGAWAVGGWMWGGVEEQGAIKAIHAAIDAGIDFIDTAPVYGFGRSEEIVGKAIADRRDEVVLATKCGLVWGTDKGKFFFNSDEENIRKDGTGGITVSRYLGPESIRREIEDSLKRLGTDHVDLYQTHWQEPTTPITDTMEELIKLRDEGKIRAIGVSNVTVSQLEEYRAVGAVDADQEQYSMIFRKHEPDLLPYCRGNDLAFLAYSPLGQGLLTGKVGPDRVFPESDQRATKPRFSAESRTRVAAMLEKFEPIAEGHGITLGQLAIAWTVAQPGCTHALAGARTPEQAIENAAAGDVELGKDELGIMAGAVAELGGDIA